MAKKNTFFGANIPFDDIAPYYRDNLAYLVLQSLIPDGAKPNDDYELALWAVNDKGAVMNGADPIMLQPNSYSIPAKKKVHFANAYFDKRQLEDLFKNGTFTLGLAPKEYEENKDYIRFDIFNADVKNLAYTLLGFANPSPPATRSFI